jgi:hypothetical protein
MCDQSMTGSFTGLLGGVCHESLWLPVLSGSMGPLLLPGDEVLVQPCPWKECSTGDVIVFRRGATLTAHRLVFMVKIPKTAILFQQGDAMHRGGLIDPESVVGRCICRNRDGSEISLTERKENLRIVRKIRFRLAGHYVKGAVKWLLETMHISI